MSLMCNSQFTGRNATGSYFQRSWWKNCQDSKKNEIVLIIPWINKELFNICMGSKKEKIIVLGFGNEILTDDGIGVRIIKKIQNPVLIIHYKRDREEGDCLRV